MLPKLVHHHPFDPFKIQSAAAQDWKFIDLMKTVG